MSTRGTAIGGETGRVCTPARSMAADVTVQFHPSAEPERSRRSMNNMSEDTKAVHLRLTEWAAAVKRLSATLGYPRESIYTKQNLIRADRHEEQISDRVANVDAAVTHLVDLDRLVINRYYLHWRPDNLWKGLEGVRSEDHFKVVLKCARCRVDGYLAAIEKPSGRERHG